MCMIFEKFTGTKETDKYIKDGVIPDAGGARKNLKKVLASDFW